MNIKSMFVGGDLSVGFGVEWHFTILWKAECGTVAWQKEAWRRCFLSRDHRDVWLMIMAGDGDCSQWGKPTAWGESSGFLENFGWSAVCFPARTTLLASRWMSLLLHFTFFLTGSAPRWLCFSLFNLWIIQLCCLRRRLARKRVKKLSRAAAAAAGGKAWLGRTAESGSEITRDHWASSRRQKLPENTRARDLFFLQIVWWDEFGL